MGRGNILDAEKHAAARYHHFFRRDAGDQRHHDLPVSQAQRLKERHDQLSDHGAEAVADIRHISRCSEVQKRPHDNGRKEDNGSRFRQVIFYFLPHIDRDRPGIRRLVFRKLDQERMLRAASVNF